VAALATAALLAAAGYGWLLHRFTNAYAPFLDSLILVFSVLGQFLLMGRRIETWWCWLLVNTIAVPVYTARELYLTAILYAGFWVNAIVALRKWRREMRPALGLVVGKFSPLHHGHELIIRRALADCREVCLISYSKPEFPGCEAAERERWLAELFPQTRRLVVTDQQLTAWQTQVPPNDADDTTQRQFTGFLCRQLLGVVPDAVFTSEDYGHGFASELTDYFKGHDGKMRPVQHVLVDRRRREVPISGAQIRADVHAHRQWLSPIVYASFVRRVCLLGGESSGKSSLAAALAKHFSTAWAPEYGRELWEAKAGRLTYEDMLAIARQQVAVEEKQARGACKFLFCDTSPLTTLFYSQHLFGRADTALEELASRAYHGTFLCAPDFEFVQDGTRQDASFRLQQHEWYLQQLAKRGVAYQILKGDLAERVQHVARALQPSS
jgi:NadR type nicotinamide-nucleotide adenylyltransferase